MDFIESSVKIALTCGAIYAVYSAGINTAREQPNAVALSTTPATQPIAAPTTTIPHIVSETTVIPASSIVPPTDTAKDTATDNPVRTLLDDNAGIHWISSLPDAHYTIQFAASVDKAVLIKFANDYLQKGAVIYPFKITASNQAMYGVASGLYESFHSALLAIDKMPEALLQQGPWIRPATPLQQEVSDTLNHPALRAEYSG